MVFLEYKARHHLCKLYIYCQNNTALLTTHNNELIIYQLLSPLCIVHLSAGFDQSGQFDIPRSVTFSQAPATNPFLASVSVGKSFESSDGVPLQSVGGSTIYREIDEKESLSKVSCDREFTD